MDFVELDRIILRHRVLTEILLSDSSMPAPLFTYRHNGHVGVPSYPDMKLNVKKWSRYFD